MDKSIALVTGASQGIGRSIAIKFGREGYQMILTGRNRQKLEETAAIIREAGGSDSLVVPADLSDEQQIKNLVEQVRKKYDSVDVLVNNAGVMYLKPFLEMSMQEYDDMMQINMRAVFMLTQALASGMVKNPAGGTIINIASLAGKNGFKGGTGYASTKWALRGFAQCLFQELREHDIRVVTIFPGSVDTALNRGTFSATGTLPANKMQPEDIAEAAYLAVKMPARTMMSEIDMRPSNPRKS